MDDTLKMPYDYARGKENYQYFRTTCGLIGFIVFFLGAFFAFIFAEETGQYENYTILLGIGMLAVTTVFFCCVLHQSRNLHSTSEFPPEFLQPLSEQEVPLQPLSEQEVPLQPLLEQEVPLQPLLEQEVPLQPLSEQEVPLQPLSEQEVPLQRQSRPELPQKLSGQQKASPHWSDKSRFDFAYVRYIFGFSPRESSDDTTSSGNDSDPDMMELRKMAKSGLPTGIEEPMAGTSTEFKDEAKHEAATDFLLDSTKARQVNVSGRFSVDDCSAIYESIADDFLLKEVAALSLSDSSNCNADSKNEQEEVSAALSRFSLDNPEKQASKIGIQDPSATDSEGKMDETVFLTPETSIKVEDSKSSTEDTKIED